MLFQLARDALARDAELFQGSRNRGGWIGKKPEPEMRLFELVVRYPPRSRVRMLDRSTGCGRELSQSPDQLLGRSHRLPPSARLAIGLSLQPLLQPPLRDEPLTAHL